MPSPSDHPDLHCSKVKNIGEFGLIDRIAHLLPCSSPEVVVGIGDDVAVLKSPASDYLLATCDCQVESVHFSKDVITPHQLGRRVVAINVSDIAAMGGEPAWALVSLVLPEEMEVSYIESLYEGMRAALDAFGGVIVGGNVSRSPDRFMIDFFLLGRVAPARLVLRSGARTGDAVLVTGHLGDSRAGFQCTREPCLDISGEDRDFLLTRHLTPRPRLKEGQLLASSGLVHAMADVSDGLAADLGHICSASGRGARIFASALPISDACLRAARVAGADAARWAMTGGEDYELVFTTAPGDAPKLKQLIEEGTSTPVHIVGEILEDPDRRETVSADGEVRPVPKSAGGWDHFRATGDG
jgi:thiamine-monophosphate kinase